MVLIVVNTFTHLQLLPKGGGTDMLRLVGVNTYIMMYGGAYLWLSFNLLSVGDNVRNGSIFDIVIEHICFLY